MQPSNMLLFYKDHLHPTSPRSKLTRIFEHTLCTGGKASYTVEHINTIFETGNNVDSLHGRMVAMMLYLQNGYHSRIYEGPAGEYEHAAEAYPKMYLDLVSGLSDAALAVIENVHAGVFFPGKTGSSFCKQLIQDRNNLRPVPQFPIPPNHDSAVA